MVVVQNVLRDLLNDEIFIHCKNGIIQSRGKYSTVER